MTITNITLRQEDIALRTPFITALRRVESVENLVVTLHTDNPLIGQGAAPATKAITGEDLESIARTIKKVIAPALLGQPFELDALLQKLHGSCKGNNSAKAAVDIALYDLASKSKDQDLVTFLGGEAGELKTAVTISLNDPETMSNKTKKAYDRGFDILKIKVGGGDGQDIKNCSSTPIRRGVSMSPLRSSMLLKCLISH